MNVEISSYPNSYLKAQLKPNEKIIVERGSMIYSDGDYSLTTKFEAKKINNWIGKIFGGKSLAYNIYKANENIEMIFSPDENGELFEIEITKDNPITIEPYAHFARTGLIDLKIIKKDWKTTINDGLKMLVSGEGKIILVGYGKILKMKLNPNKEYLIDEEYLLAFDSNVKAKTISRGLKELVKSGEAYLYSLKGDGEIWIQTREFQIMGSKGGLISNIIGFFK